MGFQVVNYYTKESKMNYSHFHEVIVVGGGPAGSVTANYLARFGFDVCLIEKKQFPREVLCGEFLSLEVSRVLNELNLFNEFLSLNPIAINKFKFVNDKGNEISSHFDFNAYALKRSIFDQLLLNNAFENGVRIYQPAVVNFIRREVDKYFVELTDQSRNNITIKADYVIAAYGKQNQLQNNSEKDRSNRESKFNAIKFHIPNQYLDNFPSDEIRIYTGRDIYCGINRVTEQHVTFCALSNIKDDKQSIRNRLIQMIISNKKLNNLFKTDFGKLFRDLPVYGTGNLILGKKKLTENGIFRIGDSAGIIAPFTGDGIGMALQSAKLLANLFKGQKRVGYQREILEKKYLYEWDKLFLNRIRFSILLQRLISSKLMNDISFEFLKSFPFLVPKLVGLTRGN